MVRFRFDSDSILIRFGLISIRFGLIWLDFDSIRLDFDSIRLDLVWIRLGFGSIRRLGAPRDLLGTSYSFIVIS